MFFSERKNQRENVHSFFFPSIVYSLVPFFFYVVRYRPISYDFGRCGIASRIDALFISPPRLFHIREECGESNFFYRRQGFGDFSCFKEIPAGKQHTHSRFRRKLLDELPPLDFHFEPSWMLFFDFCYCYTSSRSSSSATSSSSCSSRRAEPNV